MLQVTFCHPCEENQRHLYNALPCSRPVGRQPWVPYEGPSTLAMPFAATALWAAELPELKRCESIGKDCPPDSQHGGANPLRRSTCKRLLKR